MGHGTTLILSAIRLLISQDFFSNGENLQITFFFSISSFIEVLLENKIIIRLCNVVFDLSVHWNAYHRKVNTSIISHSYQCVCVCVCVCGENTQDLLLANFKFSIINYNFDIVHNSPRTFTSYNWGFVSLGQHPIISPNSLSLEMFWVWLF